MKDLIAPGGDDEYTESWMITDARMQMLLDEVRKTLSVDTVAILLVDDSRQFLVATAARGIEAEVRQGVRVRIGEGFAGSIAAEGVPVVLDEVSRRTVVNPLLVSHGIRSMLGVPLFDDRERRGEVIGVLHVGTLAPRRFGAEDMRTLEAVGERIASAVARHRAVIDRTAAAALVTSLTPRLPEIPGLQLAARYVPGSEYGVGGDWYDVFALPSGRIGITVGDVMGHGLTAATIMGRVRSWLRTHALDYDDPAGVLERVDRAMLHFEHGSIGTILYGVLDAANGSLDLASAGHLPPAMRVADRPAHLLGIDVDPPVGAFPGIRRRSRHYDLPRGSLLCLYTDGLVERRSMAIDARLDTLCRLLDDPAPAGAEGACAHAMTTMLGDRAPGDDVTMLVVSRD